MTRLERWQRAHDLGLEPSEDVRHLTKPNERPLLIQMVIQVRKILLTQEGLDNARYREVCIFSPLHASSALMSIHRPIRTSSISSRSSAASDDCASMGLSTL